MFDTMLCLDAPRGMPCPASKLKCHEVSAKIEMTEQECALLGIPLSMRAGRRQGAAQPTKPALETTASRNGNVPRKRTDLTSEVDVELLHRAVMGVAPHREPTTQTARDACASIRSRLSLPDAPKSVTEQKLERLSRKRNDFLGNSMVIDSVDPSTGLPLGMLLQMLRRTGIKAELLQREHPCWREKAPHDSKGRRGATLVTSARRLRGSDLPNLIDHLPRAWESHLSKKGLRSLMTMHALSVMQTETEGEESDERGGGVPTLHHSKVGVTVA